MNTERETVRGLLDEAKKRILLVLVCVVGLAYLMSLTSSSVWINLPAAASLIIFFRYISLDLDVQRKSPLSKRQPSVSVKKNTLEFRQISSDKSSWRRKVDSPVVEAAIDQFTRRLISEWVTNLWYSRITPDKEGPEELIQIMNHVLGEFSLRARDVNLINLLTRDISTLFCSHLELYRSTQEKIKKLQLEKVSDDHRDAQIKMTLLSDNKLHPALVSAEAEHRVLAHLSTGVISLTLKSDNLNCTFFWHTARELLACAVIHPLLNMANPRFVNEKIESLVNSMSKRVDENIPPEDAPSILPSRTPLDESSETSDGSFGGLELVQLKPEISSAHNQVIHQYPNNAISSFTGGSSRSELGPMLEVGPTTETRVLALEEHENMSSKEHGYMKNESQNRDPRAAGELGHTKVEVSKRRNENNGGLSYHPSDSLSQETLWQQINQGDHDWNSEGSYQSEDDDTNNITGLDSPVTMVWDSKTKRKSDVSNIRHPLESFDHGMTKKNLKSRSHHHLKIARSQQGKKRYRGTGQKISSTIEAKTSDHSDYDSVTYISDRFHSGAAASSSKPSEIVFREYSFLKLKCEVLGSNIVKSGTGAFAVYCISVTDAANNIWSIKRRFRHFEDLHRRFKEFPEYNLHLPPKHFLSTGLEVPLIRERCKFLDRYLKMLLQIPTLSGSVEVWDFLSVDSQTYTFSDSFSIIQTLSVDLDYKPYETRERSEPMNFGSSRVKSKSTSENSSLSGKEKSEPDKLGFKTKNSSIDGENFVRLDSQTVAGQPQPSVSAMETDATIPMEWIPSNLSMPILDLVDVVFQLQDGGWISYFDFIYFHTRIRQIRELHIFQFSRRQVFWIAKQVLQLGMGDAFDDWLIGKFRHLRRGSFVASAINRIEQILWFDGFFITKHPTRKRVPADPNLWTDEQRREAARQADFVHELMIQKAPAALVGLIGRKEYEQSAEDVYCFLQSSVCLKQLAFDLLELLLLSVFPELDPVIRQIHEGDKNQ